MVKSIPDTQQPKRIVKVLSLGFKTPNFYMGEFHKKTTKVLAFLSGLAKTASALLKLITQLRDIL
jgi:hypothetical protein